MTQFVHQLFMEVDQDGSGTIDKGEFRQMLRKLNLTYRCALFNDVVPLLVFVFPVVVLNVLMCADHSLLFIYWFLHLPPHTQ